MARLRQVNGQRLKLHQGCAVMVGSSRKHPAQSPSAQRYASMCTRCVFKKHERRHVARTMLFVQIPPPKIVMPSTVERTLAATLSSKSLKYACGAALAVAAAYGLSKLLR